MGTDQTLQLLLVIGMEVVCFYLHKTEQGKIKMENIRNYIYDYNLTNRNTFRTTTTTTTTTTPT